MSFTNETLKQTYNGDGVVTTFAIPFYNLANNPGFIEVYLLDSANAETLQTITTHYTLSPDNINPTNVVFITPPTSSQRVLITRKLPLTQPTSFSNTGPFQKEDYEKALDKVIMQIQQLNEKVDRAVLHSRGSGFADKFYPVPTANNLLVWDGSGNLTNVPVTNFSNGTYTGTFLSYNTFNLTSGALNLTGSAFSNIYCSGAAAKTITLPLASVAGAGRGFLINSDSNASVTTVQRSGSDTIEGATSISYTSAYQSILFVSNGTGWQTSRPKNLEITGAMVAQFTLNADKWVHTLGGVQTSTFTATVNVGYQPCNTTSAGFTANLPPAATCQGKLFTFENIGTANVLTIDPNASQTIDGYATFGLHPGERITIVSDSANWRTVSLQSRYVNLVTTGIKTPAASDHWHAQTSNTFTLQPGLWRIDINAFFNNGGTTPAYTFVGANLFAANGADSGVLPAALSTVSNLTVRSSTFANNNAACSLLSAATASQFLSGGYYIVECTAVSGTINLVTYATLTTAANARISAAATITRMGG